MPLTEAENAKDDDIPRNNITRHAYGRHVEGKKEDESDDDYLMRAIQIDGEIFELNDNKYEIR